MINIFSQLDFLREATALATFKHPNIIKLEAVVTASRPFMIVTELMKHGCLAAFLQRHREAGLAFPATVLVSMLRGVALGMEYLSGLNYIHRFVMWPVQTSDQLGIFSTKAIFWI